MKFGECSLRCLIERELGKFPLFVIYAFLEWVLIILLYVDGLLAFTVNEFARFFEMRMPCLFCTRLDHILVRRSNDFYCNESICEAHKKELSSMAYCHTHRKLSDVKKMCEGCLLSFATEKESDCGLYKSLVGILHKDLECFVQDNSHVYPMLPSKGKKEDDKGLENRNSDERCSCCHEMLKTSPGSNGPGRKTLRKSGPIMQAPTPSPRAPLTTIQGEDTPNMALPHIRYMELRESDVTFDDGTVNPIIPETPGADDLKAASVPLLTDAEDITDALKTPPLGRGNKFFGIPLSDSANNSPRWGARTSRKSLLEKVDFASDSADGNATLDLADGNSVVSYLKRQVKLDRKSLIELYMELDEERSASAVAANNAMAMITKLQAEKAAVQMEALQYQRMMEEQAEYDQEALQEMNNMLVKREEEIKALQDEIDAYRAKYGFIDGYGLMASCEEMDENFHEMKTRTNSFSNFGSECGSRSPHSVGEEDEEDEDDLISLGVGAQYADLVYQDAVSRTDALVKRPDTTDHNSSHS
ncbi:hypothetical protein MLD38_027953 [Melastoma candidum]|uniref:Uncharacterized protein n=2 Tax=Melastoma candidum TaxID=119954 RepID=A0ACB9N3T5_9MYRT|nr:hypothetical protein MLD38_027953 [Melastoma candidum]